MRALEIDKGAIAVLPESFAAERDIDLKATAILIVYPTNMPADDIAKLIKEARTNGI